MMTATLKKGIKEFSQAKFDRFVAQHVRSMTKSRAKGHRDWKNSTDESIKASAEALARIYNAGEVWRFVEV